LNFENPNRNLQKTLHPGKHFYCNIQSFSGIPYRKREHLNNLKKKLVNYKEMEAIAEA